jgi:hypothetical protein
LYYSKAEKRPVQIFKIIGELLLCIANKLPVQYLKYMIILYFCYLEKNICTNIYSTGLALIPLCIDIQNNNLAYIDILK